MRDMDNTGREDISEHLLDVFHLIHRKILKNGLCIAESGLSRQQYALLSILDGHPRLSVSSLSQKMMMTRPQMTVMLERLSLAGMVEREPDERDRRVTRLALTVAGRAALAEHKRAVRLDIKKNLASLTAEEMRQLSRALQTIKNIGSKLD